MSVTWQTLRESDGNIETVECYPDLEAWIRDVSLLAWEDPDVRSIDYVISDQTGEILAVAMFSPELELYVTTYDGRYLTLEMPDSYREGG